MPPLWWYMQAELEIVSDEDGTYNDERSLTGIDTEHPPMDRLTPAYIASYSTASAPANTVTIDVNLHGQHRLYSREREWRASRVRRLAVDRHWIYGASAHEHETSTCDDVSEHDITSSSDNDEWEQNSNLGQPFECCHQNEHPEGRCDGTREHTITMHREATKANSSDRTQSHPEEETLQ